MKNLSKNTPLGREISLIERLIRRAYHDGANLFGPLKEIISLKMDNNISHYFSKNLAYYLTLLKNLRFFYLLIQNPDFFNPENVNLKDILKDLMLDLADFTSGLSEDFIENSDISLKCLREPFYMILYNLLTNAYRFGEDICIEILSSSNKILIANRLRSPITGIKSVFFLPVSEDKYGILGAGVGLKVVDITANFLKIKIKSNIQEDLLKIYIDFNPLIA